MRSMIKLIPMLTIVVIAMGVKGSGLKYPADVELEMFRHRTRLLYNRLKAADCPTTSLSRPERREVISGKHQKQLEIEKVFFDRLTDLLIACEKGKLRDSMTADNDTTVSNKTSDVLKDCPPKYYHNPVSSTCLRLVQRRMNWNDSNADCESAGDRLARFGSLEAVQWFNNFIRNETYLAEPGWGLRPHWYGGNVWRLNGTEKVASDNKSWVMDANESNGADLCGCVARSGRTPFIRLQTCNCADIYKYHICEKYRN